MPLGSDTKPVITQWILDNKGTIANIDKQARAVRAEMKAERDLTLVAKKMGMQIDANEKAIKGMSGAMGKMAVAAGLVVAGVSKLVNVMGDATRQALDYEDWIGKDTEAIKGMRTATAGLISDLDLMKARTRLMNGDFKLTEKQLEAVTKAAIHYTRVNKTEFAESLKKVSDVIVRGSSRGLKDLGINMDLLGKATTKTSDAVRMITGRFGTMDIQALNTNERLDQVKNAYNNIVGSIGSAILSSDLFVSAMKKIADTAQALMKGIAASGGAKGKISDTGKEIAREQERLKDLMKARKDFGRIRPKTPATGLGSLVSAATYAATGTKAIPTGKDEILNQIATSKARIGMLMKQQQSEIKAMNDIERARAARDNAARAAAAKRANELKSKNAAARRGKRKTGIDLLPADEERLPSESSIMKDVFGIGPVKQVVDKEKTAHDAAAISALRHADALRAIAASMDPIERGYRKTEAAAQAQAAAVIASNSALENASAMIQDQAVTSLTNLAGGLWAAADAAIQGGEGMGAAVLKMLKSTLLGVAQEATIRALMETAHGIAALAGVVTAPLAAGHFAAAGAYAAVGVATGAIGLGMSAAGVGSGSSKSSAAASGAGFGTPSSQAFGKTVEDKRPHYINVYMGDPNSRSAALLARKELQVEMAA